VNVETPEKQLIRAGRRTRDALRRIRDLVRAQRKLDLYNETFAKLDEAVEDATDGLIEISDVFEVVINRTGDYALNTQDVDNLHALQQSLSAMKAEREVLIENLQDAQKQLQKYADDLQILYGKERERRVQLAEAYERLKKADSLKADFLQTINHELTSPLVPVDLYFQLIEKGNLDDEQNKALDKAKKQLTQYKRQLDGIIKYASLISQSHVVTPVAVDLQALAEDTIAPLRMLAQGRKIELRLEPVPPELNLVADRDLLSGALYQLVHNGIKFNEPGGHVAIQISAHLNGVLFQVADDGKGIPPEVMERFGQDFNQIVEAVKRGVEGLGLGLALSNYVASQHGGSLIAEHGSEKGTIVKLWLPNNE